MKPNWSRINTGYDYARPAPYETVWIALQHESSHGGFYTWTLGYLDEDGYWADFEDEALREAVLYAWCPCQIPPPPVGKKWGV